ALTASYTAGPTNVAKAACRTFSLIAGPAISIAVPHSTPLGTGAHATATLSGGAPTGSIRFQVFAASDAGCTPAVRDDEVWVTGVGSYASPDFTALAAGPYKWVARYSGDNLHAAAV